MTERERLDDLIHEIEARVNAETAAAIATGLGIRRDHVIAVNAYRELIALVGIDVVPRSDYEAERRLRLARLVEGLPESLNPAHRDLIATLAAEAGAPICQTSPLDAPLLQRALDGPEPKSPSGQLSRLAVAYVIGHIIRRTREAADATVDRLSEREFQDKVARLLRLVTLLTEDSVETVVYVRRRGQSAAAIANRQRAAQKAPRLRRIEELAKKFVAYDSDVSDAALAQKIRRHLPIPEGRARPVSQRQITRDLKTVGLSRDQRREARHLP